jgi:chitin synthase
MIVTWLPHTPIARLRFIIGFFIYLVASPFMNMIILVYALLHCDEFSWGKTRAVSDEESGDSAGVDGEQKRSGHAGPSSH